MTSVCVRTCVRLLVATFQLTFWTECPLNWRSGVYPMTVLVEVGYNTTVLTRSYSCMDIPW